MNKIILILCLLSAGLELSAQDLNAYTVSQAGSVTFSPDYSGLKTEYPPWIIPGGWRSYFFTDGTNGYVSSSPSDMINNSVISPVGGPYVATWADGCTGANMFPWRRNYYGVVSAQYFNHPTAGTVSMGFVHGENLSMAGANHMPVPCTGSDPWPTSYGAFVCAAWTPNNQGTNWGQQNFTDIGAIVWPSMGYFLPSGQKCSLGCASPSSIQAADGYMYVFYKDISGYLVPGDPSFDVPAGRGGGVKVARAPMSDALNPQAYKSWYDDGTPAGQWNPSLPAGFTMNNTTAFFRTQGPMATNLLGGIGNFDPVRFSVAKVVGTNYYLGVANYQDYDDEWWNASQNKMWPKLKVSIRYSYDLVHWLGNRVVDVTNDWTTTHFDYPIFLSTDGWSNTSISESDFYIVGTSPQTINHTVYRLHIYIPAPPPPPPPPPPLCYDDQGRPMDCPSGCVDDPANGQFCPQSQRRNAANGVAGILDESNGRAPYVYPNPGHGVFTLNYSLKDHAITQLNVLDVTGRQLQTGTSTMRAPGRYTESVNITARAKGVYLLELLVNGGKKTFKVIYQ